MSGSADEPLPAVPGEASSHRPEASEPSAAGDQRPPTFKLVTVALVCVLLGSLGGVLGEHFLRRPPVAGRHFWNFDDESTPAGTLRDGWSGNERDVTGSTFRWCAALRCTLMLVVGDDLASYAGDVLLRARMWTFRYPGRAVPQSVRLVVNQKVAGELAVSDVASTQVFHLRPRVLRPGPNQVAFEFAYAKSPKAAGVSRNDDRPLAAGFDWIELTPVRRFEPPVVSAGRSVASAGDLGTEPPLRRGYGPADVTLAACATRESEGVIHGRACPSGLAIFGPSVSAPANSDVEQVFEVEAVTKIAVQSDIVSDAGQRFHGALTEQVLQPGTRLWFGQRLHLFSHVDNLEGRVSVRADGPAEFKINHFALNVR
jgi:hypothetical protein